MAEVNDVLTCLMNYADVDSYTAKHLECSERGLAWVKARLREDADATDSLIVHTAAAVAHYYYFLSRLTETDKYESYKAGDMTVKRNLVNELLYETEIRDTAIAAASHLLKDGGFYCCGT